MKSYSFSPTALSALLLAFSAGAQAQLVTPTAVSEAASLTGAVSTPPEYEGDMRSLATRAPARDASVDLDYWARYSFRPGPGVVVRPLGPPAIFPPDLGTGYAASAGPGLAAGVEWRPTESLRLGVDVMLRTERLDAEFRSQDWAAYAVPALEYTPRPRAKAHVSFGLAAPLEFGGREAGKSGCFVFVRVRW